MKSNKNTIPLEILNNNALNDAISNLPKNYNFEIHKTIFQIQKNNAHRVALQFPEGLLLYACPIGDILERFAQVEIVIMGDVTYGACCIDDYTAKLIGCDFMIHYGHSCLVPIDVTFIKVLYVFVDIAIDTSRFIDIAKEYFPSKSRLALVSTIQFVPSLNIIKQGLVNNEHSFDVIIPQIKPLSPGEILGCTSPVIDANLVDAIVYIGDGRFHLESMSISNPTIPIFKYDPFTRCLSREEYSHNEMNQNRYDAIQKAKKSKKFGLILGTLGRQGNVGIFDNIKRMLEEMGLEYMMVLISEISPQKLSLFSDIDAWIQVACPRLSIDWGHYFQHPIMTPFEAHFLFKEMKLSNDAKLEYHHPMDYYGAPAKGSYSIWSNYGISALNT